MTHPIDQRRLRAGIVGGGRGAFIGAVHRIAAQLDSEATLIAGALSSDPATAAASAADWRLARSYASYEDMARTEAALADGIDFVIIATPNHLHLPVARAFLEAGIHVMCDKPLALSETEGREFARLVQKSNRLLGLTHTYSGYPAVLEARALVADGQLGTLRKVHVQYLQDWLMQPLEQSGQKQSAWRTDPARAGAGGALGDIGTHAHHLAEFVTGQTVTAVSADVTHFVAGRRLDDDANLLLRFSGGAKGTLVCSQVCCGEENDLSIRLYGTLAALEWRQLEPDTLLFKPATGAVQMRRAGKDFTSADARNAVRLPAGHPEGYLEAFATLYRRFAADVRRIARGEAPARNYPGMDEGLRGLAFVTAALRSAREASRWTEIT
ncbi:MAG: Gfo/Idh/MocA family oxidoreductase [Steroidobacteraceae bacterium]